MFYIVYVICENDVSFLKIYLDGEEKEKKKRSIDLPPNNNPRSEAILCLVTGKVEKQHQMMTKGKVKTKKKCFE